ncbi:hypothetical protein, partial [Croceicoccus pelagius]|uniref:hypothetical protein n=1 Tax=Croceicoccus pelagius TaxID=1703341 RepID=UPI001E391C3B
TNAPPADQGAETRRFRSTAQGGDATALTLLPWGCQDDLSARLSSVLGKAASKGRILESFRTEIKKCQLQAYGPHLEGMPSFESYPNAAILTVFCPMIGLALSLVGLAQFFAVGSSQTTLWQATRLLTAWRINPQTQDFPPSEAERARPLIDGFDRNLTASLFPRSPNTAAPKPGNSVKINLA